jgi:tRNA/tmRNA/rRNA uracil-C5-methylase (TrmA/RlmC/RlmD family)
MVESHRKERADLQAVQQQRQVEEIKVRQARFNKGLRGLFDIFNGRRKKIKKQNERDTQLAALRDREEKDTVIFTQLEERRKLQIRIERLQGYREKRAASMSHDIEQYQAIQRHQQEKFKAQPNLSQNHNRKGPQYER